MLRARCAGLQVKFALWGRLAPAHVYTMYILYKVITFTVPKGSHCTAPGMVGA
jgi:hypothetical protein